MAALYRAHQINVLILVHEGQEADRDEKIVNSILAEISDLAEGDVIIISATPAREVGR